jgi:hypothetical protein
MTKIVVKIEPIVINGCLFLFLVPNLNRIDIVINIIKITKAYRLKIIIEIVSLNTVLNHCFLNENLKNYNC